MAHPNAADCMGRQDRAQAMIERTGHQMARGGAMRRDDVAQDEKMIERAVHEHERNDHPGKPLTKLKFKAGGAVEGERAAHHLGRRARGGATKKSTHVNVIVAPQGGGMRPPMPMPGADGPPMMPPRPMAPPPQAAPAMPPPRPPMAPPPGAGVMPPQMGQRPPGMMKRGGGIKETSQAGVPSEALMQAKRGGKIMRADGGPAGDPTTALVSHFKSQGMSNGQIRQRLRQIGDLNDPSDQGPVPEPGVTDRARGGRTERKDGGRVPHMEAGAGGGEGRIEKMREYGEGGFKPKEHSGELARRRA